MKKPDSRPAWLQNADAFEAIAAQTIAAVSPVAAEPTPVPVAAAPVVPPVAQLLAQVDSPEGRAVQMDDGGRRYVLRANPVPAPRTQGRVVVGALTVSGPEARQMSVRMPNDLLNRLDAHVLGARAAGTLALLLYALDRLSESGLNLVYEGGTVRTEAGCGRIESGAAKIEDRASKKVAQNYPGALVTLIDGRKDGPWPATLVALLTFALDVLDTEPCELRLRAEQGPR